MFINPETVAIIFRCINFIAIISIAFALFKKYALPDLLLSIARKKNKQESLYTQQHALEKQQFNLDTLLKEDVIQCEKFRAHIDTWKKIVTLEHNHIEKEYQNNIASVIKQSTHRAQQREQVRLQNIVTHAVVTELEKSLSAHFQNPEYGTEYLNSIIHFMNERTS